MAGEAPVLAASLSLSAIYLDGAEPSHTPTPTPTPGPKPHSSSESPRLIAHSLFSVLKPVCFFVFFSFPETPVSSRHHKKEKKRGLFWTEQGVEDGPLSGPGGPSGAAAQV